MDAGRPAIYTEELGDKVCEAISTSNRGLSTICKEEGMPSRTTVHKWINEIKEFANKYARAREDQADYLAEEMLEIADDDSGDAKMTESGNVVLDGEFAARSRLRVDTRKWIASKLKPKKYGDKLDVTTDGQKINQNPLAGMTTEEIKIYINELKKTGDNPPT